MTTHEPCTNCTDGLERVADVWSPSGFKWDVCHRCLGCREVLTNEASAEIKRRVDLGMTWPQAYESVVHPPIPYLSGAAA